jgi:hypothetical protein
MVYSKYHTQWYTQGYTVSNAIIVNSATFLSMKFTLVTFILSIYFAFWKIVNGPRML